MIPNKLILEIEKTDKGYNITNGNSLDKENYAVKDRHQLSVVLHIFLNLLPIEKSFAWQEDMQKYGYIIILLLSYTGLLSKIISFFASPILNFLL